MPFTDYTYFKILDIYRVNRKASKASCKPRPWAALSFRLSGKSIFESKSQSITAEPGSVLYIPAGKGFSRESTDEDLIILHLEYPESSSTEIELFKPTEQIKLYADFHMLSEEWNGKRMGFEHRTAAILHGILADIKCCPTAPASDYRVSLIRPGLDLIESSYDDPGLSVSSLAKICSISEEYFRRLYKEANGISPYKAIIDRRIEKACRLLQAGYFSVEEVSERSGFGNTKHFSTVFRKAMGMSPIEYKKNWFEHHITCTLND